MAFGALIGGGISGLGSLLGGATSSKGASNAASTTAAASMYAANLSYQSGQQTKALLQPYTSAGYGALQSLQAALGLDQSGTAGTTGVSNVANPVTAAGLSGLTFQPTQAQLAATPGYQWNLAQGLRGVENTGAAMGRGISGDTLLGAGKAAVNLANNTLTTQQGIFQQNLSNVLSPLQYLTNLGQNAAAGTGQAQQSAATSAGNYLTSGASSSAASQVASSSAIGSALSSTGSNLGSNYILANALSQSTPSVNTAFSGYAPTIQSGTLNYLGTGFSTPA